MHFFWGDYIFDFSIQRTLSFTFAINKNGDNLYFPLSILSLRFNVKALKKLFSRQFYRSIPFWLIFTLGLYSALGFLLLPKLIHDTINEQVTQNLGWQTEVQSIAVNPFLLTLTIEKLAISEKQQSTISFSRFHADFELRSIFEGAFTFKNIELIDPSFNLTINKEGSTNIQRAIALHAQPEVQSQTDSAIKIPKLLFDNISVQNGSLTANDHSQGKLITFNLNPITFQLNSFSTYVKQGGEYKLHISIGEHQSLDWSGNISVAPISSQGSFDIKGIRAQRFWAYINKIAPYQLRNSNVDVQASYTVSYIDNNFQLQLSDAFLALNDIQIAQKQASQNFAAINQIKIGPTEFDLQKHSVEIDKIAIDKISLDLLRNKKGQLPLLLALDPFLNKTEITDSKDKDSNPAFAWSINEITVNNSQVNITDKAVKGGASIKIHQINASLSSLNQSLANKQAFSLDYQIDASNKNSISGDLTAIPFKLDSHIKLSKIPLSLIQPYLSEIANVKIKKGDLSLQGQSKLTMKAGEELIGDFKGSVNIANFDSSDTIIKRRLLGWKDLSVTPIKVNLSPLSIDIKEIKLTNPYSRLIITEDRNINFNQLMIQSSSAKKVPSTAPSPKVDINKVLIKNGKAYFADRSLRPQFGTSIQNINGVIKGLSSSNLESADVAIKGTVEEYGKLSVKGKINPLSGDLSTDINVNFDKIELTTLTPYSGRYAGYIIEKGKLSLSLNYKIAKGMLDGKNRLILDQFELGDAVDSEESVDLPIKLALALFKDSKGVIDISLPTKGDMNSPDFEIRGLIFKALLNVMTKAISSPFSLLANLAGGDEQSLNSVAFELGSASLTPQQKESLNTLAKLLKQRPQLILDIRVNVDSDQERKVLKKKLLTTKLAFENKNQTQQIQAMEDLFTELQGKKSLDKIKKELAIAQSQTQETDQVLIDKQYHKTLFDRLITLQPISSLDLTELAQQRISAIKHELIIINKVDNQQVFALQPSLKGASTGNTINTIFTLTSK